MTQEEKDALVDKMADSIGDVWDCEEEDDERLRVYARAALSIAEPIIRKKALEEAATKAEECGVPYGPFRKPPDADTFHSGVRVAREFIAIAIRSIKPKEQS